MDGGAARSYSSDKGWKIESGDYAQGSLCWLSSFSGDYQRPKEKSRSRKDALKLSAALVMAAAGQSLETESAISGGCT